MGKSFSHNCLGWRLARSYLLEECSCVAYLHDIAAMEESFGEVCVRGQSSKDVG